MLRPRLKIFLCAGALSGLLVLGCVAGPARLPIDSDAGRARDLAAPGSATASVQSDPGTVIARAALDLLGTPYRYGGTTPEQGLDCSGLVQFVHAQSGIAVPRTSAAQFRAGHATDKLQPGDVVYFRIGGRIGHAGVYLGDGRFVHAPKTGRQVSVTPIDQAYYRQRYAGARRFR